MFLKRTLTIVFSALTLMLLSLLSLAHAVNYSYCPSPRYIQENLSQMAQARTWKDNLGQRWEVDAAIFNKEAPFLRFTYAVIWRFPKVKEGIFITCNYTYPEEYTGLAAITSLSFKLKNMPHGGTWHKNECVVDPFDRDNPGSGNILECPFETEKADDKYLLTP